MSLLYDEIGTNWDTFVGKLTQTKGDSLRGGQACGTFLLPEVGQSFELQGDGYAGIGYRMVVTSEVVRVYDLTDKSLTFDTLNSTYHLFWE